MTTTAIDMLIAKILEGTVVRVLYVEEYKLGSYCVWDSTVEFFGGELHIVKQRKMPCHSRTKEKVWKYTSQWSKNLKVPFLGYSQISENDAKRLLGDVIH